MCACVEPVGTAIGAVCVESGGRKWMLNHAHIHIYIVQKNIYFFFLAPYARTTLYEEAFFSLENQGKKGWLRSRAS